MADSLLPGTSYEERWSPWFMPIMFWFPCTWRYEVVIAKGGKELRFGYGPSFNLMKKAVCLDNICDVTVGTTTWKENLLLFGGWGIRYGRTDGVWFYNAANGPWVQFTCKDSGRKYRFATRNQTQVAQMISDSRAT